MIWIQVYYSAIQYKMRSMLDFIGARTIVFNLRASITLSVCQNI